MFHIALSFLLFPYKLPKSFFKQSCQLCLFQSLIYKEPADESKDQVGKLLQHFHYQPAFESTLPAFHRSSFCSSQPWQRAQKEECKFSRRDGFQFWPNRRTEPPNPAIEQALCFILQQWILSPETGLWPCNLREFLNTVCSLT